MRLSNVFFRQCIGNQRIADRRLHEMMAPGHDDDVLSAFMLIGHRSGLPPCRSHIFPDRLASPQINSPDKIIGRRSDKDEATAGH